ncbi:MAG: hypothetical protein ACYC4S_09705 [Rhodoferax sp.]
MIRPSDENSKAAYWTFPKLNGNIGDTRHQRTDMGRISKIKMLSLDDYSRVNEVIRVHHYAQLDVMVDALNASGIHITRSALHRYTQKLQQLDGQKCQDENVTVVVIMTRATGATDTILTPHSAAQIRSAISKNPVLNGVAGNESHEIQD